MSAELAVLTQLKPKVGDIKQSSRNNDFFSDGAGTWLRVNNVAYDALGFDANAPKCIPPKLLEIGISLGANNRDSVVINGKTLAVYDYKLIGFTGTVDNQYTITLPSTITASTVCSICGTSSRVVISDKDTTSEVKLSYSNDGVTFTNCIMADSTLSYKVACKPDGALWVASALSTATAGNIFTSTDGRTWTPRTPSGGTIGITTGLSIYFQGAGKFIYFSITSANKSNYTTDGFTLATLIHPTAKIVYSVHEVDGVLYCNCSNGTYFTIDSAMNVSEIQYLSFIGYSQGKFFWSNYANFGLESIIYYGSTLGVEDGRIYVPIAPLYFYTSVLQIRGDTSVVQENMLSITVTCNTGSSVNSHVLIDGATLLDVINNKYSGYVAIGAKSSDFVKVK